MKARMSQKMKRWTVLFAGLAVLALPLAAQQEVSPDHFDEKPSATQSHKPSPAHKTATAKSSKSASRRGSSDG